MFSPEACRQVRTRIESAARRVGRDPSAVRLIAVSKGMPATDIRDAVAHGIADVSENYLQEARAKRPALAGLAVTWHFTGHLQSNKAREVVHLFDIIHTVDSEALLERLERLAEAAGRRPTVLLEVNQGGEAQKAGVRPEAVGPLVAAARRCPHLQLAGLMTIPPPADEAEASRPYFRQLAALARELGLGELSMGMSDDYEVAVEEGATMVRIGRALYGERSRR